MISSQPFKLKRKAPRLIKVDRTQYTWTNVSTLFIVAMVMCIEASITMGFSIGNERFSHTRKSRIRTTNSDSSRLPQHTTTSNWNTGCNYAHRRLSAISEVNDIVEQPVSLSTTTDEEAVDAYLEFLDRRYRRLHEDGSSASNDNNKTPFSVWKWLHHQESTDSFSNSNNNDHLQPHQSTEDALYVLGVAGLASKKLLQKHHLLSTAIVETDSESMNENESISNDDDDASYGKTIDVDATTLATVVAATHHHHQLAPTLVTETAIQTIKRVLATRNALIQYQSKQIKATLSMLLVHGPIRLIRSVWKWSGGKRTITRTLSMTIALSFILFRTLSFVITNETMTHGGAA